MRMLVVLLGLAMLGMTLVGCKASGEIDGDTNTSVMPAR